MGPGRGPLPRPGSGGDGDHPGRRRRRPARAAFFNVAFRGAEPLPDVSDTASLLADPRWWRDKLQGNALRTGDLSAFHADVDFGKLARRDDRRLAGPDDRRVRPHPRLALRAVPGRRLREGLPVLGRLRGRAARAAAAVRDLHPQGGRQARAARADAAAALARRQLQPVRRLAQPGAVRRPHGRSRDHHAVRPRARRLVLRPRGRRHLRGVGRRRAPLPARPGAHGHRRLLDGRLRHVQVRRAVPRPVRARPADGRPARPRRLGAAEPAAAGRRPVADLPPARLAAQHPVPDLGRGRRRARPVPGPGQAGPGLRRPRLPLRVRLLRAGRAPDARRRRPVRPCGDVPRQPPGEPQPGARHLRAQPDDGLREGPHEGRPRVLALGHPPPRRLGRGAARHGRRALARLRPRRRAGQADDARQPARSRRATSARSPTRPRSARGARRRGSSARTCCGSGSPTCAASPCIRDARS